MIDAYEFGKIKINSQEYEDDVMIIKGEVKNWWREQGHLLQLVDLKDLPEETEVLVVGTGHSGNMKVSDEVRADLKEKGVKLIEEMTREACNEFNRLIKEGKDKKVVAALNLTC